MSEVYKFSIPGKPENIHLVRLAVGAIACNAEMCVENIEDLELAAGEAFKNICCHGSFGWSRCVNVICEIGSSDMIITITDEDEKHDLPKGERPCLDCPREGDLGYEMIKAIMDNVELITAAQGKKTIRMVKGR